MRQHVGHGWWSITSRIALVARGKLIVALSGQGSIGAAFQTMTTRIVMFALNIGTGVITARTMGAEGRGLLAALLTWPQFIAYLATFGLTNSLLYNVKANPRDNGRLLGATICLGLLAGGLACLAGIILMPWMLPGYGSGELVAARLMMTTAPIVLFTLIVQTAAEAAGDFPGSNALRGISVAGTFTGVALFAGLGTLGPVNATLCYLLPQAPVAIWLFWRLRPRYQPSICDFGRSAQRLMSYGLRCYPVDMLNTALAYAGQALVITMLAPIEVGYFTVAIGISRLLEVLSATAVTIVLPATAGRPRSEITEQTLRAARLLLLLMLVVVTPLMLALPILIPMVYGPNFQAVISVARLLLLEGAVGGTVLIMMQAFFALGRPEPGVVLQVIALVLLVSLLMYVVPRYGVVGAAAVLLGVAVMKLGLALVLYRVVLAAPASRILPGLAEVRYIYAMLQR